MKLATPEAKARGVYGILFLLSLPIPLFHHRLLSEALLTFRPPWMLRPIENIILSDLGGMSMAFPVVILILLVASWRWPRLCAPKTLVIVAVAMCAFVVLYAVTCSFALWMALIWLR